MYRLKLMIILLICAAVPVAAQDSDADEDTSAAPPAEVEESAGEDVSDEEIEELLGLDEEWSDIDEEEFDPTEEVRFEQSIPFPVDI